MTLIPVGNANYVGLSGDRPTVGIVSGTRFVDLNTGVLSFWDGSAYQHYPRITAADSRYVVWISGSLCQTMNSTTGIIEYSGTNSTSGIQLALNSLTSGRTMKETVKVKGSHNIAKILIPSFTTLDLRESRLFQISGTNTLMIQNENNLSGNTDIEFIGGLVDGNRVGQTGGGTASGNSLLMFHRCKNVSVHHGKWIHANYHCMYFLNCYTGIIVANNRFENWKQEGVEFVAPDLTSGQSNGHIVESNYFTHHRDDPEEASYSTAIGSIAIASIHASDVVINGNIIKNTMAGSCLSTNGVRTIITNNIIIDGAGGDNVIGTGTTSAGIVLAQGADQDYDSSYTIIANNIVKNMGKVGIHVQQAWVSKNIVINGNYVERCGESGGISSGILNQEADGTIISNNIVRDCFGGGIRFNGSTIHSVVNGVVSNNICFNNGRGESATDTHRVGIGVDAGTGAYAANVTVIGNRCYDISGTQKYGIRALNALNSVIKDNDVRDNATSGIALVTCSGMKLFGNEGHPTENGGIFLGSGNASTTIYTIPHGLSFSAGSGTAITITAGSAQAQGDFRVSGNASNIVVTYGTAPASGDVRLFWEAKRYTI